MLWTTVLWYPSLWNSTHDVPCTKGNYIEPCLSPSLSPTHIRTHRHNCSLPREMNWPVAHQGPGVHLNPSCWEKIGLNWASEQMWRKKAQNSVLLCLPLLRNTLWWCQWVHQQPSPCFCEPNSFTSGSEIPSFQFFSLILVSSYATQSCYPRIRSSATVAWLWSVDEHMCSTCVAEGTMKTSALENWLNSFCSPPSYFQSQVPNAFSNGANSIWRVDVVFVGTSDSFHLRFITKFTTILLTVKW